MRLQGFLGGLLSLASLALSVVASPVESAAEPEILVVASFPENNPFGHVVNGERNQLNLFIENKSGKNVTLTSASASLHHPETNTLLKNISSVTYGLHLFDGMKIQLPYTFYSEFKPGDVRLNLWIEHTADDQVYYVSAYDSIVQVVEPELSWFDFKLISTYLMVAGLLSGLGYFAYLNFAPQPKARKTRSTKPADVSSPVGNVTATGAGGYQEEWIPEHHLRKGKKKGGVASGDELSGGETSGAEGRKRKGRK